jgi:hypothetical protein
MVPTATGLVGMAATVGFVGHDGEGAQNLIRAYHPCP